MRSSWGSPEWIAIEGKLHSRRRRSSSVARETDLTKMQTCERKGGQRSIEHRGVEGEVKDLVELQRIEQVIQLAVLGGLLEANVVLLQSVESELLLVVDVDLEGLLIRLSSAAIRELGAQSWAATEAREHAPTA